MATFDKMILIGSTHMYHGGIIPTHYMFLSQNSRPAWILVNQNIIEDKNISNTKIVWIPTVENMLEDAFLMIAVHINKNSKILELAKSFYSNIESNRIELYECFKESQREELYKNCRQIKDYPDLIITCFHSISNNDLDVIKKYKMDVMVCDKKYSRSHSVWSNETEAEET